jgi:CelD/BcsL family acetyltransferase involved in cellulose biosynthesis
MIDSNRAEGFLREVAAPLASLDALRIFTLRFQERIAAIILALCHRGAICSYLSAFDPEYEKFGCGRELLARALHYACTHGYRCWDFLRGDEPYKLDWGAQLVPKARLLLEHRKKTLPMP